MTVPRNVPGVLTIGTSGPERSEGFLQAECDFLEAAAVRVGRRCHDPDTVGQALGPFSIVSSSGDNYNDA